MCSFPSGPGSVTCCSSSGTRAQAIAAPSLIFSAKSYKHREIQNKFCFISVNMKVFKWYIDLDLQFLNAEVLYLFNDRAQKALFTLKMGKSLNLLIDLPIFFRSILKLQGCCITMILFFLGILFTGLAKKRNTSI